MRKIREVLRLKAEGFSDRQIAAAIGSARSTVQECARRARDSGVSWPLPPAMDEAALHAKLYKRVVPIKVRGTRILFTLGTHLKAAKAGFLEAAQALAAHAPGIEIHFSDGALTGTQSSRQTNFQRLSFVNYDAHIKQYDVVIHHGGTGIMNHCLGNGIPAIVYPMDYDQLDYAAR